MDQEATPQDVTAMASYLQSQLDQMQIFSYGEEPEMQVDFHIPCSEDHPLAADALSAMVPCLSRQHTASAFKAGAFVQLSLHKEPSSELAEAFFQEALGRIASDEVLARKVADQIAKDRKEQNERIKARMAKLQKLKAKASAETAH